MKKRIKKQPSCSFYRLQTFVLCLELFKIRLNDTLESQLNWSSVHTRSSKSTQMQQHAHKALKVNSTAAACTQGLGSQLNYSRMHTRPCEFHPIDIVWRFAGHYINIKIFLRGSILEKWKTSRFVHMIFSIFQCNYFFILFTLWNNLDSSCNLENLRTIEMT